MTALDLLNLDPTVLASPGAVAFTAAPSPCEALALGALLPPDATATALFVAANDARMDRLATALAFFAPHARITAVPAWDCLPYDRVPPHADIAARRLVGLGQLAADTAAAGPHIVLTTVAAVLQRVPPKAFLADAQFEIRAGAATDLDALNRFLAANGYVRTGTVREAGEFAVRGGIIDIFPPGADHPTRLDMFGDEVEALRAFDPITQLTLTDADKVNALELRPVSEVMLTDDAVTGFRSRYRATFGVPKAEDALYEAVSAGHRHPGMEHWLPLFYDRLESLFDYLPPATPVLLDDQARDAIAARLDLIADYFAARRDMANAKHAAEEGIYNPLAPDALYLTADQWRATLADRPHAVFTALDHFVDEAAPDTRLANIGGRVAADFADARTRPDINLFDAVANRVTAEHGEGRRVIIAAYTAGSRDRLTALLTGHGIPGIEVRDTWDDALAVPADRVPLVVVGLERGFQLDGVVVLTEQDILGDRLARVAKKSRKAENFISEVSSLHPRDLVVHVQHGIGMFEGLETLEIAGAPHDCLRLIYAGGDKLFLPVENLELLSRFGSEDAGVTLDRLGGAGWQARKAKVKERIRDIAEKLLEVAAARQLREAPRIASPEGLYDEFVARFPFHETDDQERSIADVLGDLASGRPMDRLVCGDVGFGKTEVALRAAFVTAMTGRQVAVVVPTTLLARQHAQTFADRFAGLPIKVGQLSRLVAGPQAKAVKEGMASGDLDIVIGTHALLAKSITFANLGLVIVDEEQHFGVVQKERLKQLKQDVHVLTLTATPIPRTLQLALTGVRELSLISTPPVDRLAVRTFVLPYDPVIIREAIMREHFRGGQVFYVCPRIEDLAGLQERLRELVPEVKVTMAHGQMPARELEAIMAAFYEGQFQVLLSTNIVESGLDIPTANTIIIHRSDRFGLSQLYQLRGRVGRSKTRAYAYLTLPAGRALSETAQKRLDVMQTLDSLGAGFSLASHDLDIRGAGNLLGDEQSGHIREVGVELYQQMLEDAVATARDTGSAEPTTEHDWTPSITIGTPVLIPESFVADLSVRLGLYRRAARIVDDTELDAFAAELIDRFGSLPAEVENLLQIVSLKRLCRAAGVEKLDAGPKGAVVTFRDNNFADPAALIAFISSQPGAVKLRPDHKLVYQRDWAQEKQRLQGVRRLMTNLSDLATGKAATAA